MSPDRDESSPAPASELTVLYADISGSTRLYEKFGNAVAQKAIASCLELLSEIVERNGGRVVQCIGDEIQCVFEDPAEAMIAGTDMQPALMQAGETGRFATGPMRIKVGFHAGHTYEVDGEVQGEGSVIAQAIAGSAKPDQVLTSVSTLESVPNALRVGARYFDQIRIDGLKEPVEVCELIWDDISITQEANFKPRKDRARNSRVVVSYEGQEFEISESRPKLTVGRVKNNDLVIPTTLTSRMHAEFNFRRGRCYITDSSVNGTMVMPDEGRRIFLRREHVALEGSGRICFSGTPEQHPESIVTYRCLNESD